jgi:TetR/AcrR family transcriptional regulator, mexJK operon transcriptional repressor
MNTIPALGNPRGGKSPPPIAKRGRPLDAAKHKRIIAVATQSFLELGFGATSMDLVARRAKVSKVTVYSHFKSKEALFGAIIDGLAGKLVSRIERFALGNMEPAPALRQFGRMYLELALASSSLALHRVVVAESARIPGLGRLIYQNGPVQVVSGLAEFLVRQETLRIADPRLAAEQFLGMVLGHAQLRLLLNARPGVEVRASIERVVDHAVEIFLNGVLPLQRPGQNNGHADRR